MGTVWLAYDELLRREVAVKEVRIPDDLDEMETQGRCERALREARAAARITHPNVVTIYDVAEDDGRPWIVMELVRAPSLTDVLDEGRMAPHEAAEVGLAVLAALRAARAADVLHRDVKPSNILMAPHGRIVLTDFGIATVVGSTTLTATGMLVGSPEYLAPERVLGRRPGPASDLWSLGVTLYQAVEGFSPFRRTGAMDTLSAVLTEEPAPPRQAGALWPAIEALLRKDPLQRADEDTAERLLTAALVAGAAPPPVPPGTATVEDPNGAHGATRSAWQQGPPVAPVPPVGAASAGGRGDAGTGGYPETAERAYSPADAVYGSPTSDDRPNPILIGAAGTGASGADVRKRRRAIALGAAVTAAVIALAVWLPMALGGPDDDKGGSSDKPAASTSTSRSAATTPSSTGDESADTATGEESATSDESTPDDSDEDAPTPTYASPPETHTPTSTATWDETTEPPNTHTPTTEPPATETVDPTTPGGGTDGTAGTGGAGGPESRNSAASAADSSTGGSGG